MRSILTISLLAAVVSLPLAAQSATSCDRACLAGVMTAYLDSLVAHDPGKAPLAANARFTEDAKELRVGDGLWKTAGKLRPFRTDFLDAATGTAATHAVVEENGMPVLLAATLRPAEPGADLALLAEIANDPLAVSVRPLRAHVPCGHDPMAAYAGPRVGRHP